MFSWKEKSNHFHPPRPEAAKGTTQGDANMQDEFQVKVHSYGPTRPLSLVYVDPISGKKKAKSAGTSDWREAERLAGELQKELEAGRYAPP